MRKADRAVNGPDRASSQGDDYCKAAKGPAGKGWGRPIQQTVQRNTEMTLKSAAMSCRESGKRRGSRVVTSRTKISRERSSRRESVSIVARTLSRADNRPNRCPPTRIGSPRKAAAPDDPPGPTQPNKGSSRRENHKRSKKDAVDMCKKKRSIRPGPQLCAR